MVNPIYQQGEEILLNQFGSKYLGVATHTNVNSNEFIVQEDAVISVLTGGDSSTAANNVDYKASMDLSDVTLKQGALIVAPQGESFQSITIDSGTIMAYNSVVGGTKPSVAQLLLDLYPDAAAAYSLRKLRTDYTGASIKVRRSSDNTEQDIGFVDGELDTVSLLNFVGAGDGFVTIWYDQSGGGNDALQTLASLQPRIVSLGVVETLNGFPAIYADGTKLLITTSVNISVADVNGNRSSFGTLNVLAISSLLVSYADGGTNLFYPIGYGSGVGGLAINLGNGFLDSVPYTSNTNSIFSSIVSNSNVEIFNNNISDGSAARGVIPLGETRIALFSRNGSTLAVNGYSNEIILYPSDQTANRVAIEDNINTHYTIY